jgi:hypothetical protein
LFSSFLNKNNDNLTKIKVNLKNKKYNNITQKEKVQNRNLGDFTGCSSRIK